MNRTSRDELAQSPQVELDLHPMQVDVVATVAEVLELMCKPIDQRPTDQTKQPRSSRVSYALVMDAERLVGIFTERDVLRLTVQGLDLKTLQISDCMTRNLITICVDEICNPLSVLAVLRQHRIRHLPVVDDEGRVVGVATAETLRQSMRSGDFLRLRRVEEVMTRRTVTATAQDTVISLVQRMVDLRVSCVVIVEAATGNGQRPIGIVTERDVVQMRNLELDLERLTAAEVMSAPLEWITPEQSLWDIQQAMERLRVRRLVVVEQDCLVGIVTQTSILAALDPVEMYHTIELLQAEIGRLQSERLDLLQQQNTELILKRQQQELALQDSQQQYRELVDRVPVGVYKFRMSANGKTGFDYVSPRWCEMNQLDAAAVVQNELLAFEQVHPDERDGFQQLNEQGRSMLQPFVWEGRMVIDGQVYWRHIESSPTLQDNGDITWDGIQYDVTDRKAAETERLQSQQLRNELSLLENILDVTLAGYWDWDMLKQEKYLSAGFKRMLGYEQDEWLNTSEIWQQLMFSEDLPPVLECLERHVQSRGQIPFYNEVRYHHKDGSTVWTICFGQVIEWNPEGNPLRMIGCHVDITPRKQAELQLEQLNQELTRSNQDLEQFAYIASHDLQEPLRAIIGYTQLLSNNYGAVLNDPIAQESLAFIIDGGERMRLLIRDLLAYSRISSQSLKVVATDCNDALAEVLQNLKPTIEESQAVITSDRLPSLLVDKTQLVQLFQNLIGNAIKFRRGDPIQIHIHCDFHSDPAVSIDKISYYQFSVSDNGIGIKSQYLTQIFDIFRRLHSRRKFPGTGIGLAICKKIVERHGGEIWVTSEFGQGTTFFFTLPANLDEGQSAIT
jgi:PAS domain S-box-containing protein